MCQTGILRNTVLEEFQGLLVEPEILVTELIVGDVVDMLCTAS
jgi:hypothetical protein